MNAVDTIRSLTDECLSSKQGDVVRFVSNMLPLLSDCRSIRGELGSQTSLQFTVDKEQVVVETPFASAVLRAICARLAATTYKITGVFNPYISTQEIPFELNGVAKRIRIEILNQAPRPHFYIAALDI